MTHPAILAFLSAQPAQLTAADLLARLYAAGPPATVDDMLAVQDEIQAAITEADRLAYISHRAVGKCLKLQPIPGPKPPPGF